MKKYTMFIILISVIVIWGISALVNGGELVNMKKQELLSELMSQEKTNNWIMLTDIVERTGVKSYTKQFVLSRVNPLDTEKINIDVFTPDEWPSKNLGSYAVSPDSSTIAFVVSSYDNKTQQTLSSIYAMPIDGGEATVVLSPQEQYNIGSVCWLHGSEKMIFSAAIRDGEKQLIYSLCSIDIGNHKIERLIDLDEFSINSQAVAGNNDNVLLSAAGGKILTYNIQDGLLTEIADGMYPTWIPASNKISFQGKDKNYYSIDSDGKNKSLLIENKSLGRDQDNNVYADVINGELLWSPDGRFVYFERIASDAQPAPDEYYLPYIMDIKTKEVAKLPSEFYHGIKSWIAK